MGQYFDAEDASICAKPDCARTIEAAAAKNLFPYRISESSSYLTLLNRDAQEIARGAIMVNGALERMKIPEFQKLDEGGGLYNYPLKYFPASQPDGTYNLDLPDSDPLKEDYPNVKVTVVAGKVWVSEATLISRKMPNQPIVTIRALPNVIDNFQIPPLPNSIRFKPVENHLAQRMRYHD